MRAGAALAIVLVLVLESTGCTLSRVETGQPIDPDAVARIERGLPKADVLERLGPPDDVRVERTGTLFQYIFRKDTGANLQLSAFRATFQYDEARDRADRLVIEFDRHGLVREVAIVRQTGK